MGIEMQELSGVHRVLMIDKLNEQGKLEKMPEDWVLALDSKPVEEWSKEMIEFLKDSLPNQDD